MRRIFGKDDRDVAIEEPRHGTAVSALEFMVDCRGYGFRVWARYETC